MKARNLKTFQKERPICEQDREWYLPISYSAGEPHASALAIRMNSTYLEMVDGYYANRGVMSAFSIFALSVGLGFLAMLLFSTAHDYLDSSWNHNEDIPMFIATGSVATAYSLLIFGTIMFTCWIGEWSGYTHYPIRLNRRNRMVYVFRGDGTVLEAPWDATYFTLYVVKNIGVPWLGICGLVMKDETTVQEQFMFGYSSSIKENCFRHWEFMRRYMEDGPSAVMNADGFRYCLPIADRKETPYQGWVALVASDAWNPVFKWLMFSIHAVSFLGRIVWRATSKVPLWPADVQAACRIEPGDPYVRDSRSNPEGFR
ncbi:hypothetical protein QCE47_26305 [Caballeronia sp. LZ025]|uniref:DUF6708 domain-containing protein n=1 Tax=Caballeronia TaxID=1827195 RepID=UPI001FD236B1|nr:MULTISPECIES: DUF6708 domain-containing protein [Caballeronia]MDR5735837.1 hypothetical protein [Caballeronia sp. LZ025]